MGLMGLSGLVDAQDAGGCGDRQGEKDDVEPFRHLSHAKVMITRTGRIHKSEEPVF